MNNWFTSDLHIGHANVIKYCHRPWHHKCTECEGEECPTCGGYGIIPHCNEMDEALIANFNECVQPKDNVYIIGDIIFSNEEKIHKVLNRLNGHKHVIFGNHDKEIRRSKYSKHFASTGDYKEIKIDGQRLVLMHYAMRTWNKQHKGAWQLFGHSHNNLLDLPTLLSMDVGVDAHDYRPISFEDVKGRMNAKIEFAETNGLQFTEDHHTDTKDEN